MTEDEMAEWHHRLNGHEFELLAVQETLKSLLQHHSSKASILYHSAFFMVQLSQQSITTGKSTSLTICTFFSSDLSAL